MGAFRDAPMSWARDFLLDLDIVGDGLERFDDWFRNLFEVNDCELAN